MAREITSPTAGKERGKRRHIADGSSSAIRSRPPTPLNLIFQTLPEDHALLARFAAGDEESLAVVYERHRPALHRQAARLLYASGHDPDDVLQDVFLRVHGALRGGVVPLEPRAWLLRLVHNACIDELRRARTRPVGDEEAADDVRVLGAVEVVLPGR
jgi:hypothetical protein